MSKKSSSKLINGNNKKHSKSKSSLLDMELNDEANMQSWSQQTRFDSLQNSNSINTNNNAASNNSNQDNINNTNRNNNDSTANFSLNQPSNNKNYMNYRSNMEFYRLKLSKSKLKAVTRTSALLSGFAMVAMVELGLDYSDYFEANAYKNINANRARINALSSAAKLNMTKVNASMSNYVEDLSYPNPNKYVIPESILILYALVTCLLVGVHMLALMISTCILPQIEASTFEHIEIEQLQRFDHNHMQHGQDNHQLRNSEPMTPSSQQTNFESQQARELNRIAGNFESDFMFPYKKFHRFIELAWVSSTVIGIFLFLVEIGLVCYIKFYPISFFSALTGAIVMVPILILFVLFTFTFYKRLADFKINATKQFYNQINRIQVPLHDNI